MSRRSSPLPSKNGTLQSHDFDGGRAERLSCRIPTVLIGISLFLKYSNVRGFLVPGPVLLPRTRCAATNLAEKYQYLKETAEINVCFTSVMLGQPNPCQSNLSSHRLRNWRCIDQDMPSTKIDTLAGHTSPSPVFVSFVPFRLTPDRHGI